jgi:hypothetical protein
MKKTVRNFTRDEKASIAHAIMHLEANQIATGGCFETAWYCGNKEYFITRHKRAIAFMQSLLTQEPVKE